MEDANVMTLAGSRISAKVELEFAKRHRRCSLWLEHGRGGNAQIIIYLCLHLEKILPWGPKIRLQCALLGVMIPWRQLTMKRRYNSFTVI